MEPLEEPKLCAAAAKPPRPPTVVFESIRDVYLAFEAIFLSEAKSLIVSPCGHKIYCFEHHVFHMAGIAVEGIPELSIHKERDRILATDVGFAHYELREGGSRVRHLRSARETLENPDEVWAENPLVASAKWVYVKEFDSKPHPFSIGLVGEWHSNSTIIVPFSSFACARSGVKRWRQGKKIYP